MTTGLYLLLECFVVSSLLYLFLHKKTRIRRKFLFTDNIGIILLATAAAYYLQTTLPESRQWSVYGWAPVLIIFLVFTLTMIRFWRSPKRTILAREGEIVSPADGTIIYIKRVEDGEVPVGIKGKVPFRLQELTRTDLLKGPCWLIGINMTLFDVHKNCAPIDGKIMFCQHSPGRFLSLKHQEALTENERQTYVIGNGQLRVGVVQTASRLVRRIDAYVRTGDKVRQGEWLGMIRFGSQVDILFPLEYSIPVREKEQIYAGQTIIGRRKNQAQRKSHSAKDKNRPSLEYSD